MKIELLFFGQLTDKIGCTSMHVDNPGTIFQLKELLLMQYPALKEVKFTIALNNKLVIEDASIPENSTIAMMPPFSGG
jgi:molybdopterin synthase sulfur carrier subunit